MKCTQFYPVLMTDCVAETARFFVQHLRFQPVFDSDWYVHLQSAAHPSVNLGLVESSHATIPPSGRVNAAAGDGTGAGKG